VLPALLIWSGIACQDGEATDSAAPTLVACSEPGLRDIDPLSPWDLGDGWSSWPDNAGTQYGGSGLVVADLDGDGLLDVLVPGVGADGLWLQQGDGSFEEDGAARVPDGGTAVDTGASAADVDGDGDLDLFVTVLEGPNRLLLNDGGAHFSDATATSGLGDASWHSVGSSWADFDGDGWLDLFVGNHREEPALLGELLQGQAEPAHPNRLWRNLGDGTFAAVALGAQAADGFTFSGVWTDLDDDGDPDLVQLNDFGPIGIANQVLWNQDGLMTLGDDAGLGVAAFSMGGQAVDEDGDGHPELLVAAWNDLHWLQSAGDGTWYDAAQARGLVPTGDQKTAWGGVLADLDNDGDLDVSVQYGFLEVPDAVTEDLDALGLPDPTLQPDEVWLQGDDGGFSPVAADWGAADTGVGRGGLWVDLDGDGWRDWLKRELDGPPKAYRAQCGDGHWLQLSLAQDGPNGHGIGARIGVEAGSILHSQEVTAGSVGLASGAPPRVHVGLGSATTADRVVVRWPDGGETEHGPIDVDQRVVLRR